jgi:hypothetical protein
LTLPLRDPLSPVLIFGPLYFSKRTPALVKLVHRTIDIVHPEIQESERCRDIGLGLVTDPYSHPLRAAGDPITVLCDLDASRWIIITLSGVCPDVT